MKVIYKIYLIISLLFVCANIEAQVAPKKRITGDFKFGVNWAEMDVAGGNMYKDPKIGVIIGGNVNYKLISGFQLQSGFYVVKKGLRQSRKDTTEDTATGIVTKMDWKYVVDANYAQIPLNIGFEHFFTDQFGLNINAGVYAAYGFKGKRKTEGTKTIIAGTSVTEVDLNVGETDTFVRGQLSRFDYGVGFNIGAIYDIYSLTIGYDRGLRNVSDATDTNMKTRSTYVAVGFRF
ncbi:MAG: outer membrane beta-barrel protein [Dysgonomonas sp.]